MAFQGPLPPSDSIGVAWSNSDNAFVDDGALALASAAAGKSANLTLDEFGFSIPAGATIDGVVVELNDFSSDLAITSVVGLLKAGSLAGLEKDLVNIGGWVVYGNDDDLWDTTWTAEEINDPGFGIRVRITATASFGATGQLDAARVTVHYTETGDPPQQLFPVSIVSAAWTPVGAATTWEAIDEITLDTGDYALSPVATAGGHEEKVRVAGGSDPGTDDGIVVKFDYEKEYQGGDTVNLVVNLYQADGTTLVATTTITNVTTSGSGQISLTSGEAATIPSGDWATGLVLGYKEVKA